MQRAEPLQDDCRMSRDDGHYESESWSESEDDGDVNRDVYYVGDKDEYTTDIGIVNVLQGYVHGKASH